MATISRRHDYSLWRYRAIFIILSLACTGLIARLGYIQIVQHQEYVVKAEEQYGIGREIPATRGSILSSDGFELASTQPAYLVYADPSLVKDPAKTAKVITNILNQHQSNDNTKTTDTVGRDGQLKTYTAADMEELLKTPKRRWVPLARQVDSVLVDKIKQQQLAGIGFQSQQKRYYPEGSLASQILGFVGQDDQGKDQGYYGIEGYFDRDLRGKDGRTVYDKDPSGNPIPVGNYSSTPAEDGATITLTINRGLQYLLEQKLKQGVEDNHAEAGSVILMEVATGKMMAMANYPTFDPSDISQVTDAKVFKNSAITDIYEPGSVMKSFTMATGIDLGILSPTTPYHSAPYKVGDHTITTANNKYYGDSNATKMLEMSDNTGAAQFGLKIGRDNFITAFHTMGLDRPTGITLQGEASGYVPDPKSWLPITLATASFGQGISVTPLQLLEMMATIANNGTQMKPTIIQSVTKNGQTTEVKPEVVGQIFKPQTAKTVTTMLQQVVINGEFHRLALQGYNIAGKTSTAQIPIPGGYDPDHTITTFVGYAPAQDPKFVMLVKLNKPSINNSAQTVVPVWMNMAKDLFQYYGISQQKTDN